jgi:hypothetical protein
MLFQNGFNYENKAVPAQLEKTQELLDKHIVHV